VSNQWAEVHSELTNKIRWAVATSSATAGIHLTYRESQDWARSLARDVLQGLKRMDEKPDYVPWAQKPAPSGKSGENGKVS